MRSNHFFLILAGLALFLCRCRKDVELSVLTKPPGCDSIAFSYKIDIRPLMIANCSGPKCHSGGNSNYDYSTYEVLADRVRNGHLEERLLLPASDPMHMPYERPFGKCDLFTLRTWIHQGYKNN